VGADAQTTVKHEYVTDKDMSSMMVKTEATVSEYKYSSACGGGVGGSQSQYSSGCGAGGSQSQSLDEDDGAGGKVYKFETAPQQQQQGAAQSPELFKYDPAGHEDITDDEAEPVVGVTPTTTTTANSSSMIQVKAEVKECCSPMMGGEEDVKLDVAATQGGGGNGGEVVGVKCDEAEDVKKEGGTDAAEDMEEEEGKKSGQSEDILNSSPRSVVAHAGVGVEPLADQEDVSQTDMNEETCTALQPLVANGCGPMGRKGSLMFLCDSLVQSSSSPYFHRELCNSLLVLIIIVIVINNIHILILTV